MRKENGKIKSDIQLDEELLLSGMCTGNIIVLDNGYLRLNGMCTGDIEVRIGGHAIINGICTGLVSNMGGTIEINGIINDLRGEGNGVTTINPNAVIKNRS